MLSTKELAVKCEQVRQQAETLVDRVKEAASRERPLHELERELFDRPQVPESLTGRRCRNL